jgi:osmotically-inducible protein OsmY
MSEKLLRQNIIDELDFEPSIEATNIGVAVKGDVVTLTGHVPTYAQKIKAEEVARNIRGVRAIAQEIEVRPPAMCSTGDDAIAERALALLDWDVDIPRDALQVMVAHGWVTLTGEVAWQYQRRAAENNIRKLNGVLGVMNLITLKHQAQTSDVQTSDIKKQIEDALRRNAQIEAENISVDVQHGKVTLEGKVATWQERNAVEATAWATPGVRAIEDRVRIG